MHRIFVTIHIWSSAIFTIVAIVFCFMLVKGLIRQEEYKKKYNVLEFSYIGLLYLGLFLGIIMYFFVDSDVDLKQLSLEELRKKHTSQFWAIEHFSVMLFTLLIAQIGKLFTNKAITSKAKFKYALFYYGAATFVTFISMTIYLYYKYS